MDTGICTGLLNGRASSAVVVFTGLELMKRPQEITQMAISEKNMANFGRENLFLNIVIAFKINNLINPRRYFFRVFAQKECVINF
jgi:hypothetical protein